MGVTLILSYGRDHMTWDDSKRPMSPEGRRVGPLWFVIEEDGREYTLNAAMGHPDLVSEQYREVLETVWYKIHDMQMQDGLSMTQIRDSFRRYPRQLPEGVVISDKQLHPPRGAFKRQDA